jgi:hypothetical protein
MERTGRTTLLEDLRAQVARIERRGAAPDATTIRICQVSRQSTL